MDKVYSLRHLGFFSKPLLTVSDRGFTYKGKLYKHENIKRLVSVGGSGKPHRLGVSLDDGAHININAVALELNGVKPKTGFLSGTNTVFEELKKSFEKTHTYQVHNRICQQADTDAA